MSLLTPTTQSWSQAAHQRLEATEGGPFMRSDWVRTLMVHYEVEPAVLQPLVPFELDDDPRANGKAYVSLVMFTMERLRPNFGGRAIEWFASPFSNHGFLNVRTYVKHQGEPGIYFLAEWLPNHLSRFVGRRTFGLPYRYGQLTYDHHPESGQLHGRVTAPRDPGPPGPPGSVRYAYDGPPLTEFAPCTAGSLEEFLMERYTAFTLDRSIHRLFRIWHEPWPQAAVAVEMLDESLLAATGTWRDSARIIGANYSPGVTGVWMGRPRCIQGPACGRVWAVTPE